MFKIRTQQIVHLHVTGNPSTSRVIEWPSSFNGRTCCKEQDDNSKLVLNIVETVDEHKQEREMLKIAQISVNYN